MAEKAQSQEPTMEEILASIRRIISEDGATVEPAPPPDDSVLDLTELLEAEPATPQPDPSALKVRLPEPEIAPEVVMEDNIASAPASPAPRGAEERLISDITAQAAAQAMSGLATPRHASGDSLPIGNGGRTLESMVLEILRPVLKDWLDRNLPSLVERIVQKEIRKITRDVG